MKEEKTYYLNGQLKREAQMAKQGDKTIVKYTDFYDDGKKSETGSHQIVKRSEMGYFWSWDEFHHDGLTKSWRRDGTLASEMSYKEGKEDGVAREYRPDGKTVMSERVYEAGRVTRSKEFDEKGRVTASDEFFEDGSKKSLLKK